MILYYYYSIRFDRFILTKEPKKALFDLCFQLIIITYPEKYYA